MLEFVRDFLKSHECSIVLENKVLQCSMTYKCIGFIGVDEKYFSLLICYNEGQLFCPSSLSNVARIGECDDFFDYGIEACCRVFDNKEDYCSGKYILPNKDKVICYEENLRQSICNFVYSKCNYNIDCKEVLVTFVPIMIIIVKYKINGLSVQPIVFRIGETNIINVKSNIEKEFITSSLGRFGKVVFPDEDIRFMG